MSDTPAPDTANLPLEIHDLTAGYHKKPVLWGIDLQVPRGKLVGIVGPNGAGKSTLIKAITVSYTHLTLPTIYSV